MSKRRDDKGRILRSGEIQRSNGRYVYQYTDFTGRRRSAFTRNGLLICVFRNMRMCQLLMACRRGGMRVHSENLLISNEVKPLLNLRS